MISACIFLLLSLLAHGASTSSDSRNPASYPWYSNSSGFVVLPPLPRLRHNGQAVVDASRPAHQPAHHDQPLPESISADAHPNPAKYINYDERMDKRKCVLPTHIIYLIPGSQCYKMRQFMVTTVDGMAITLHGSIISLPKGSIVVLSNEIRLPTEAEIRVIDNLEDALIQTTIILPEGTMRRTQRQVTATAITKSAYSIKVEWIVFTPGPEHNIIFLPKHTSVVILPHIIRLPTGKTEIRGIGKKDQDEVMAWCKKIYDGWQKEKVPWEEYRDHCYNMNLWKAAKGTAFAWTNVRPPARPPNQNKYT